MAALRSFMTVSDKTNKGSLWRETTQSFGNHLSLENYNDSENKATFHISDVEEVTTFVSLLIPLTAKERIAILSDTKWLSEGISLQVGETVKIVNKKNVEGARGILRYKGEVTGFDGTYFGVELLGEHIGKGSSDGEFRETTYFKCHDNCGIFVPLTKVRLYDETLECSKSQPAHNLSSEDLQKLNIQIGDRVVWLNDNPKLPDLRPEGGVVRWIGKLEDATGGEKYPERNITAGVEFDNPIGKGNGLYKNKQLFEARRKHASYVPVLGLIKETEYYDLPGVFVSMD